MVLPDVAAMKKVLVAEAHDEIVAAEAEIRGAAERRRGDAGALDRGRASLHRS